LLAPGIAAAVAAGISFFCIMRRAGPGPAPGLAVAHLILAWLGACALAEALTRPFFFRRAPWMPAAFVALIGLDAFLVQRLSITISDDIPVDVQKLQWETAHHNASIKLTPFGLTRSPRWSKTPEWNPHAHIFAKLPVLEGYNSLDNRFYQKWTRDAVLMFSAVQLPNAAGGGQAQPRKSRIWFSSEAAEVPLSDDSFDAFSRRAHELKTPPLVVHAPEAMKRPSGSAPSEPGSAARIAQLPPAIPLAVRVISYEPMRLAMEVESPGDGWLWVTDRWASGWRATVNERPTPVWGGNFVFRAVRVEKGRNLVTFTYHPFAYPWLLLLSWGTLALVGGSAAVSALRQRPKSRTAPAL
jgi:hypothetical protein